MSAKFEISVDKGSKHAVDLTTTSASTGADLADPQTVQPGKKASFSVDDGAHARVSLVDAAPTE
jgi:hypothetical protein